MINSTTRIFIAVRPMNYSHSRLNCTIIPNTMDILQHFSINLPSNSEGLDYSILKFGDPLITAFEFELVDLQAWGHFISKNWYLCFVATAVYLISVFGLQSFMRKRKGFDLRRELFLWNAALGLFSILGFIRLTPALIRYVWIEGFANSLCVT